MNPGVSRIVAPPHWSRSLTRVGSMRLVPKPSLWRRQTMARSSRPTPAATAIAMAPQNATLAAPVTACCRPGRERPEPGETEKGCHGDHER